VPFGLRLSFSGTTDASLKELAGLKYLQALFPRAPAYANSGFRYGANQIAGAIQ